MEEDTPTSAEKSTGNLDNLEVKEGKKVLTKDGYVYVPWGVTSFGELQTMERGREVSKQIIDLASCMPSLVENIMLNEDITDKAAAIRETGIELGDIAKELMAEVKGKSLLDTAKEALAKLLPQKSLLKQHEDSFTVFKDAQGRYAWFGRYSNNIVDDDPPPKVNLIAAKSHLYFLDQVEKGLQPYPELWLWHESSACVGKSTWLDYDEETGVAMAAGFFDEAHYDVAEKLSTCKNLGMSHGLLALETEGRTVTKHITHEISVLPVEAAANKRTSFMVMENKEKTMINENKAEKLMSSFGMTAEDIAKLNSSNKSLSAEADALNLTRKEEDTENTEVAEIEPETVVEPEAESTETVVEPATAAFTPEQVAELKQVFDLHTKSIEAIVKPLVDQLAQVKEQQPQTLAAMLFSKEDSADVPDAETSKPAENKEQDSPQYVGDPGLNAILSNIFSE